jgi:hypothetical protein
LVVLHREATAGVPEVAPAEVQTLRQKLGKVGAVVRTSARRIGLHFSQTWPYRALWQRVQQALVALVGQVQAACRGSPPAVSGLLS